MHKTPQLLLTPISNGLTFDLHLWFVRNKQMQWEAKLVLCVKMKVLLNKTHGLGHAADPADPLDPVQHRTPYYTRRGSG